MRQINENKKDIAKIKERLFAMVCGNPKDLFLEKTDDGCYVNPIDAAAEEFERMFSFELRGLEYLIAYNVDLQYIHDNFERTEIG